MERVQFQQEQMLPELRDLEDRKLFSKDEVRQILKKRTAFETALVRRVAKKSDYLQYLAYEIQLETLRKKRVQRLKLATSKRTVSDYALVRRQLHIMDRAVQRFKADIALWVQYIRLAQKEGARTLAGKICARALRLHPNTPALYVLAASHELAHLSPSAARTLLQRGLRLNGESVELWREYARMELGYVERLRRRWDKLGAKSRTEDDAAGEDEDEDEGEAARRLVLDGAIVCEVITNAIKAAPRWELFEAFHGVLISHPWSVRANVMQHLLESVPPAVNEAHSARFALLRATRSLGYELKGSALCDALVAANVELVGELPSDDDRGTRLLGYARWVESWAASSHAPPSASTPSSSIPRDQREAPGGPSMHASEAGATVVRPAALLDVNLVRIVAVQACTRVDPARFSY
ncbi:U3 small nucleolar RNA-associated protein 6-domain-containing protein [Auriculariales sp. MPI-PUGE-AT-0066]|nr:U3 small nucleolar RNA-associated protein 6-domain-containing protein [Auriculariales sp. MPI-PUGE-AT-0066]